MLRRKSHLAVLALALSGCEFIAGLTGDRSLAGIPVRGGGGDGGSSPSAHEDAGSGFESGGIAGETNSTPGGAPPVAGSGGPGAHANGGRRPSAGGTGSTLPSAGTQDAPSTSLGGTAAVGAADPGGAGEPGVGGEAATAGTGSPVDDGGRGPVNVVALTSAPSCSEPAATCPGSDCFTLEVPPGSYQMGRGETSDAADYYPTGNVDETPAHAVSLTVFWLDEYEVTVGRFRRFVDNYALPSATGVGDRPEVSDSGWRIQWNDQLPGDAATLHAELDAAAANEGPTATWTSAPGPNECKPINMINWYLAYAFCIWDGGRLPFESEWEYAAAGGEQERLFPWGHAAPDNSRATYACSGLGSANCTPDDLRQVGSARVGDGRFGHADLAGSLEEFVRDEYSREFYAWPQATGTNVLDLEYDLRATYASVRGGSYDSNGATLRSVARRAQTRSDGTYSVGFRCARNAE
jgi:formylglycine-generating enzyme required for sulfatase activity